MIIIIIDKYRGYFPDDWGIIYSTKTLLCTIKPPYKFEQNNPSYLYQTAVKNDTWI